MNFFKRKFHECPEFNIDEGRAGEVMKKWEERDPESAHRIRRLVSNPTLKAYRLITTDDTDGRFGVHYVRIEGGADFPHHVHEDTYALLYIAEGKGYARMNDERFDVEVGDVIYIPPGVAHEIVAEGGPLAYVAAVSPDFRGTLKTGIDFHFVD